MCEVEMWKARAAAAERDAEACRGVMRAIEWRSEVRDFSGIAHEGKSVV